jgi:hypothetical protein
MEAGGTFARFGARLRAAREARGLTVEHAASAVGVDAIVWAAWEAGATAPVDSATQLAAMCRVLRADAAWLLGVGGRHGQPDRGQAGWATQGVVGVVAIAALRAGEGAPVGPGPAVRLGAVRLRGDAVEIAWRLRPGDDPAQVRDVWVEPVNGGRGVGVEVQIQATSDPQTPPAPTGVFRLPVPAFGPPWTVRGLGPDGPWRREQRVDGTILEDYRRGAPVREPGAAAEHAGVSIRLVRVRCLPDRLAVFTALDAEPAAAEIHAGRARLLRRGARPDTQQAIPTGPTRLPPVQADAAYFSPVAPGAEVDVEFPTVDWSEQVACHALLPLPAAVPAEVGPSGLPDGYGVTAVCWSGGLLLDLRGPQDSGVISPALETEDGRPVPLLEASGGDGRTVAVTGALPEGARAIRLRALRVPRQVRGPWILSFRLPEEGAPEP